MASPNDNQAAVLSAGWSNYRLNHRPKPKPEAHAWGKRGRTSPFLEARAFFLFMPF